MLLRDFKPITEIPYLVLSVTDRCNLNCAFCYKKEEMKQGHELPLQEWKEIYDRFLPQTVQIFGGEPTLRWADILEFLEYAYPKAMALGLKPYTGFSYLFSIISNGTTDADYNDIPKEFRGLTVLSLSLDGFAETNDRFRGQGSYEKAHATLIQAMEAGIRVNLTSTFTDDDYLHRGEYIQRFVDFYEKDIGVNSLALNTIFTPNTPKTFEQITSKRRGEAIEKALKIKEQNNCHHFVITRNHPCGQSGLIIQSNGEITPKCSYIQKRFGHWRDWSSQGILKLHNYINRYLIDCTTVNFEHVDRYAQGLLLLEKQAKEGGGGSGQ